MRSRALSFFPFLLLLFSLLAGRASAEESTLPEAKIEAPPTTLRLELYGDGELYWPCGVPYEDPGFAAWDAEGRDRSGDVRVEGSPVAWRVGDYPILYFYPISDGELAAARRIVHVVPQSLPEVTPPPSGTICLTFDDGPCADTAYLLDVLARYNVKATFFIVANRSKYLDILPRIAAEGHTLGIHCYDHRSYEYLYKDMEHYCTDLLAAQKVVHDYTGQYAHVVRFPGGSRTASLLAGALDGQFSELYATLADMGIRAYDWTVQPESDTKDAAGTVTLFAHPREPYEYAVVLQHDTRVYSVYAVEQMIQWALDQGYRFAALDETFPEIHFEE